MMTRVLTVASVFMAASCGSAQLAAHSAGESSPLGRACQPSAAGDLLKGGFTPDTTIGAEGPTGAAAVKYLGGPAPRYPQNLRIERVEGRVRSNLVVDTLGAVIPGTVFITFETRREFGDAVCVAHLHTRFTPLIVDGRRRTVRLLEIPTTFTLIY